MQCLLLILLLAFSLIPTAGARLEEQSHELAQEKVFLHLDNNCYFVGDTIWYKAYVVRADDHCTSDMSRILYVELLNEQGYLVERQQLMMEEEAQAWGQIALADSI